MTPEPEQTAPRTSRRTRRLLVVAGSLALVYFAFAYLLAPLVWEAYEWRHPAFDDNPRLTETSDGHPGDPLNVALIATEQQIKDAMHKAKWYPAAALGLRSDIKIAADTVLSRPDDEAPVSNLYLYGRKEDLAFEQPVGDNPRQRHHARFWRTKDPAIDDQPTWIGSASYDERVGLSHTTGQITHHIAPDVDKERNHLFDDLKAAGALADFYVVDHFHSKLEGRNGGGDPWHTDGSLYVGGIAPSATESEKSAEK